LGCRSPPDRHNLAYSNEGVPLLYPFWTRLRGANLGLCRARVCRALGMRETRLHLDQRRPRVDLCGQGDDTERLAPDSAVLMRNRGIWHGRRVVAKPGFTRSRDVAGFQPPVRLLWWLVEEQGYAARGRYRTRKLYVFRAKELVSCGLQSTHGRWVDRGRTAALHSSFAQLRASLTSA